MPISPHKPPHVRLPTKVALSIYLVLSDVISAMLTELLLANTTMGSVIMACCSFMVGKEEGIRGE